MEGSDVRMVDVRADIESSSTFDTKYFENISYLKIDLEDGKTHVWSDGTHYVKDGTADTVSPGDAFLMEYAGPPSVAIVDEIEERESETVAVFESGFERKVNILTGDYQMTMGDPGPPPLLTEQPLE